MENTLTQQRKSCSTIHHALDEFKLVDFAFDQSVVLGKRETCHYSCFVSFNPQNKTL
jgi:hypothetical protein